MALADIVGQDIRVIYPAANGKKEVAFTSFKTTFESRQKQGTNLSMALLCYRMGQIPQSGQSYEVNHFCAVTELRHRSTSSAEDVHVPSDSVVQENDREWRAPKRKRSSTDSMVSEKLSLSNRYSVFSSESEDADVDCDAEDDHSAPSTLLSHLQDGKLLDNETLVSNMIKCESPNINVPKNNVFVIVQKKKSTIVDDCGPRESGTTVNQKFEVTDNNKLKGVYENDGFFVIGKM